MNEAVMKLESTLAAASKRDIADLVIKNGRIIDVFNLEIIHADVAIKDGIFVGIGEYEGRLVIDANNRLICPGFIDGHVHIESSMLTPDEFAKVIVPHGVTTVIADPHEIANVCGADGIEYMLASSEDIPLDVFYMLPSCVPATSFEHAGAQLDAEQLAPFYKHERVIGLGEVMNSPAVLNGERSILDKLVSAAGNGKLIDGHAAGLNDEAINAYMTAGIRTDHECTTADEALDRLQRGMYVMIREGSAAKNLFSVIRAVNHKNARRCLFVTDDKHLDDLINEGSIDHNVRLSIQAGLDPLLAIQMATLNAAECYRLTRKGAIAPGYVADFVLLEDLESVSVSDVYKSGKLVASDGSIIWKPDLKTAPPVTVMDSIHAGELRGCDLNIVFHNRPALAHIIGIIPDSIVTQHLIEEAVLDEWGCFQSSTAEDQLKLVIVERHKKTGNVGLGIVKGLGISSGAIASTVAHDSHNIVAAGTNDADLLAAIQAIIRMKGGIVVADNEEIQASLPLPVAGLISDQDSNTVYSWLGELNRALRNIGFAGSFNPFLTLSFLALPVIPQLKLTDQGLFDVTIFKHIQVEADLNLHHQNIGNKS